MVKKFKENFNFITNMLILLTLVFGGLTYAVGFHTPDEIISGTFNNDYSFNGSLNFTNANITGLDTYTWKNITKTLLGSMHNAGTISYNLPSSIPNSAKEVLLYYYFSSGSSCNQAVDFEIFTNSSLNKYSKYFFVQQYPQSAVSFNSENSWFPITADRKIFITTSVTPCNLNSVSGIYAIGYM